MISKHLLLFAALLLPASLLAGNVMEMRYVVTDAEPGAIKAEFGDETLWLSAELVVSDADVIKAYATASIAVEVPRRPQWSVAVEFNAAGTERFDAQAATHFRQRLAILVNGKVHSAPVIQAKKFGGKVEINGHISQQSAEELAKALQPKEKAKP